MGQLYEKMASDLKLRRYSIRTQKSYLWCARRFVRHHMRSPAEIGGKEIRDFLLLHHERGASASSIKMYVASLRFLYAVTLGRPGEVQNIPWPRVAQKLPAVIDRDHVRALLGKIEPLKYRMIVMTAYGTGLRISEILALEIADIDGKAGLIHVRHGKGDRPAWFRCPGVCWRPCASIGVSKGHAAHCYFRGKSPTNSCAQIPSVAPSTARRPS
jgi:integrase/recombinase XerD